MNGGSRSFVMYKSIQILITNLKKSNPQTHRYPAHTHFQPAKAPTAQ